MATINGDGTNETLVGTSGNDTISGLGGDDILDGGAGNDTVNGGSGNDRLTGGAGNDGIVGGTGTDTAVYNLAIAGGGAAPVVTWSASGVITVVATASGEGTDTVREVEFLEFAGVTFTVNNTAKNVVALIRNDTATVSENAASVGGNVLTNDLDPDSKLAVSGLVGGSLGSGLAGTHGSLTLNADGTFSYVPTGHSAGVDTFTYQVTEAGVVRTATLSITVQNVNDLPVVTAASASIDEDQAFNGSLAGYVTDEESTSFTFAVVTGPAHGSVLVNADGTFTFTPTANYFGEDSFTYSMTDGDGGVTNGVFSFTIASVNDAPVANDSLVVNGQEDSSAIILRSAASTDAETGPGQFTHVNGTALVVGQPVAVANGTVTLNFKGDLQVTPDENYVGPIGFDYTVSDGSKSDDGHATVNFANVNDRPKAVNDTATMSEDGTYEGILRANDVDRDVLTYTLATGPAHGEVTIIGNGNFAYTPHENYVGEDSFTFTVDDGNGGTATGTWSVNVGAVDDAPEAGTPSFELLEDATGVYFDVDGAGLDVDGQTVTVVAVNGHSLTDGPVELTQGTLTLVTDGDHAGELLFTPKPDYNGTFTFTFTLSDGSLSDTGTATVDVGAVNDKPVAVNGSASVKEDGVLEGTVVGLATDIEGDSLTYELVGGPVAGLVFNSNGAYTYTPAPNYNGGAGFTFRASDGHGGYGYAAVNITVTPVNDAPVARAVTVATDEDTEVFIEALSGTDIDGPSLQYTHVNGVELTPAGVDVGNGTVFLADSGRIKFVPDQDFNGQASFTFTINDGEFSSTATATVNVAPTDDAPIAPDFTRSAEEDSDPIVLDLPGADPDGQPLTVSIAGTVLTAGGAGIMVNGGSVALNNSGDLVFTPDANFSGIVDFDYKLTSGATPGLPGWGAISSASDLLNFGYINSKPGYDAAGGTAVITGGSGWTHGSLSSLELGNKPTGFEASNRLVWNGANTTVTLTAGQTFSFEFTAAMGAGSEDVFAFYANGALIRSTRAASESGAWSFTAPAGGNYKFTFAVGEDGLSARPVVKLNNLSINGTTIGATPGDPGRSDTGSVHIDIAAVNDAPQAGTQTVSTPEDQDLVIDPLSGVSDVDSSNLVVRSVNGHSLPLEGSITVTGGSISQIQSGPAAGQLLFTPDANYNGPGPSLEIVVSDGELEATNTINVSVTSVDDAPVAADIQETMAEDGKPVIINLPTTDADGQAITVSIGGQALELGDTVNVAGGTVTLTEDNDLLFKPAKDFNGTVEFDYTLNSGLTATGHVTIEVTPENDAPVVAEALSASTDEDTGVVINPLVGVSDVDEDAVTVTHVNGQALADGPVEVTNGVVSLITDGDNAGRLLFTPAANYNGPASFSFTLSDGDMTVDNTVEISVAAVDDAPVAPDLTLTTEEDSTTVTVIELPHTDPDGQPVTVSLAGEPLPINVAVAVRGGTVMLNSEGNLEFIADKDFSGAVEFDYTLTSGYIAPTPGTPGIPGTPPTPPMMIDPGSPGDDGWGNLDESSDIDHLQTYGDVAWNGEGVVISSDGDGEFGYYSGFIGEELGGQPFSMVTFKVHAFEGQPISFQLAQLAGGPGHLFVYFSDTDQYLEINRDATSYQHHAMSSGEITVRLFVVQGLEDPENPSVEPTLDILLSDITVADMTPGYEPPRPEIFIPGNPGTPDIPGTPGDPGNPGRSDTGHVTIDVTPVNDRPVAADFTLAMDEDQAGGLVINVLGEGKDVDRDTLSVATVNGEAIGPEGVDIEGGHLSVIVDGPNAGNLLFTPAPNFFGAVSFGYTLSDGSLAENGESVQASVDILVNSVDDAPDARDGSATLAEDRSYEGSVANLVEDVDTDSEELVFTHSYTGRGTLTFNPDGSFVYHPARDFSGLDRFTWTVSDGTTTVTRQYEFEVTPENDRPTIDKLSFTMAEDSGTLVIDVLGAGHDADGDALILLAVNGQPFDEEEGLSINGGYLSLITEGPDAGKLLFRPASNWNGETGFNFTLSDGLAQTDATVGINITPVDDPPSAPDRTATAEEDATAPTVIVIPHADKDGEPVLVSIDGGDFLTVGVPVEVDGGTVILNEDGNLEFTPGKDFNGTVEFDYTLTSGYVEEVSLGLSDTGHVTIEVTPVNDAPIAADLSLEMDEDQDGGLIIDVLGEGADVDGDELSVSTVNGQPIGPAGVEIEGGLLTLILDGPDAGNLLFTPAPNFNGAVSFTYSLTDGTDGDTSLSEEASVDIVVNPVNDAPTATDGAAMLEEDTPYEGSVAGLANDIDTDASELTFSYEYSGPGELTFNADGTFTYVPAKDFAGTDSFTWTVSDGDKGGSSVSHQFVLHVTGTNDAPTAESIVVNVVEDAPEGVVINVLGAGHDIDGDVLELAFVNGEEIGPEGLDIYGGHLGLITEGPNAGNLLFVPSPDSYVPPSFTYQLRDPSGALSEEAAVDITITPVNDAPRAEDFTLEMDEDGEPIIIDLPTEDVDGEALTVSVGGKVLAIGDSVAVTGGTVTLLADNDLSFKPNADFNGTIDFDYTLTDSSSATGLGDFESFLGGLPNIGGGFSSVASPWPGSGQALLFSGVGATDEELQTFMSLYRPISGGGTGSAIALGPIVWDEDAIFSFSIQSLGGDAQDTFLVMFVAEDETETRGVLAPLGAEFTITDFNLNAFQPGMLQDGLRYNVFVALTNFAPTGETSSFIIDDFRLDGLPFGTGPGLSDTGHVQIVVKSVNDPVEAADLELSTDEDDAVTVPVFSGPNVDEGEKLTVATINGVAFTGEAEVEGGVVRLTEDGRLVFTPNADYAGEVNFTYSLTDGEFTSDEADVVITVAPQNDAPDADNGEGMVKEDGVLEGSLATLVGDVEGDSLLFEVRSQPEFGEVTIDPETGAFVYTPFQDFNGTDSFEYSVSDGYGGVTWATYTVTVTPLNDAPFASGIEAMVDEDQDGGLVITLGGKDIDRDELSLATVNGQPLPEGGLDIEGGHLSLITEGPNSGKLLFTPNADFNGSVSFEYTVKDPSGAESRTASADILVNPVDDAPVAADFTRSMNEDGAPIVIDLPTEDVDGEALTVSIGDTVLEVGDSMTLTNGTVTLLEGNDLQFTPNADFNGRVAFDYTLGDGHSTDTGHIQIDVAPVNDPVTAQAITGLSVAEDAVVGLTVPVFSGPNVDAKEKLTVATINGQAFAGSAVVTGGTVSLVDGQLVFTPTHDFNGEVSFTYSLSDGEFTSDAATVSLVVTPVNDAPILASEQTSRSTDEDTAITGQAGVITDVDKDKVSYVVLSGLDGLSFNTLTGAWTFDPSHVSAYQLLQQGQSTTVSFTYAATDGIAQSNAVTVQIAIAGLVDVITGSAGADSYVGTAFVDIINGEGGDDVINGMDGDDTLSGGAGDDTIVGGAGADQLSGGAGDDTLSAGAGNDILQGGLGDDTLIGGAGTDVVTYAAAATAVNVNLLTGVATGEGSDFLVQIENLVGSAFDDALTGSAGANTLDGGAGDDIISGGDGVDTLRGGTGNDYLYGGALGDNLDGGDGDDFLYGGINADTLTGGLGADRFVMLQESIGASLETDTITDFNAAQGDVLDVTAIDANTTLAGDQAFTLVASHTNNAAGQVTAMYGGGYTTLRFYVNGDNTVDYQIRLAGDRTGTHVITASDPAGTGGWLL